MEILKAENLIRNYKKTNPKNDEDDIKVLKGVNFTIEEKEFVGIMGKSGCGKTTLKEFLQEEILQN
nr:ATP-binding cassette domain-containing protein [uncultured Sellimonas sp.]